MKIIKILWVPSLLGCLTLVLLSYASMPLEVVLAPPELFGEAITVNREVYFYLMMGVLLLFNIILNMLGRAVRAYPPQLLVMPKKRDWFYDKETREELYINLKEWIRGISFIFNIFLCALIGILQSNNSESNFPVGWIIYLSGIMAIGWLVFYFVLFSKKPKALQEA